MNLAETLREYIQACFTGLWVESHEHEDALAEIAQLCRDEDWRLATWDVDAGLSVPGQAGDAEPSGSDPLAAIRAVSALAPADGTAVVATCNDISKLPPEFSRAERFDGVFFVDLPSGQQRKTIWDIYVPMFGLDPNQTRPKDDHWTGAEVRACCRLAALLDIPLTAAAQNVVPVAVTAAESVERLRSWAGGRCLSADKPGIFARTGPRSRKRRAISIDPSNN